jgi:antibiotic biosynthesis monooxygenase (ABM) superfamily enzyme
MMPTPSFLFFRTNSKKTKSNLSSLPPYSKRALVAVVVAIPMAFGLNVPLNSMASFMPIWGVIMINAIVIPSYMTFIIPRASKLLSSWLSSTTTNSNGVN